MRTMSCDVEGICLLKKGLTLPFKRTTSSSWLYFSLEECYWLPWMSDQTSIATCPLCGTWVAIFGNGFYRPHLGKRRREGMYPLCDPSRQVPDLKSWMDEPIHPHGDLELTCTDSDCPCPKPEGLEAAVNVMIAASS